MLGIIIGSVTAIVLGIVSLFVAMTYRQVVKTNMVHIVQSATKTVPFGKGQSAGNVYYKWPAPLPRIGVTVTEFPESIFQVQLNDYEAYDSARVPFVVDVTAFFRIEESQKAAQRVSSFRELCEQLELVLQGSVRRILATNDLEQIMEARGELGKQFTDEVRDQLAEWGVIPVKTIEFMDLRDSSKSSVIEQIMAKEESRIEKESRVAIAENQAVAEQKEIDAKRIVEIQRQSAAQKVGERTAEKDKSVGIANEVARQEIQSQAALTAEKDMKVLKVQEVRKSEIRRDVAIVRAEEEKRVAVVNAEGVQQSTITVAEGELKESQLAAKGIEAVGIAEGVAERAKLQAPVDTQISLAKEIGENMSYQEYLIKLESIKAGQEVGIANAVAIEQSDTKIIVNSGDVSTGVSGLADLFSSKGGTAIGGMIEALSQTEQGKALMDNLTGLNTSDENTSKTPNIV